MYWNVIGHLYCLNIVNLNVKSNLEANFAGKTWTMCVWSPNEHLADLIKEKQNDISC